MVFIQRSEETSSLYRKLRSAEIVPPRDPNKSLLHQHTDDLGTRDSANPLDLGA